MLSSPLYRRFLVLIVLSSVGFTAVLYALSVPYIRDRIYSIEERGAVTVVDNLALMLKGDFLALADYRRSVQENHEARMKSVVALAVSMVKNYRGLPEKEILARLRDMVYDRGGYLWVADTRGRFLVHPDPSREGKSFAGKVDELGNPVLMPLIEKCLGQGEGFHSYWDSSGELPVRRLLYARLLPEYGWILGTEIPVEDIEGEIAARKERMTGELRKVIRELGLKHEGNIFVFDSWDNVIVHSDPARENTTLNGVINPVSGRPLTADLKAAADRNPAVCRWCPAGGGGVRMAWVRYVKGFDWYVVFSVEEDRLNESARRLRNRLLATATVFALVAMVVISLMVARFLAPIRDLSRAVARITGGDLDAVCEVRGNDEVSRLAAAFNSMVARLREYIHDLDLKVRERTRELDEKNRSLAEEIRMRQKAQEELAQANRKLMDLSVRDPLTGLFNRRYMEETLAREFAKSKRTGNPCGVIMLDVDFFKKFNDTYGHEAGDLVLKTLADTLRGRVRGEDVVCRYGGEEFIIILPEISRDMARLRAEELRKAVAGEMRIVHDSTELKVTISLGVALFPEHGDDPDMVVGAADQALYASKESGRNRVTVAGAA